MARPIRIPIVSDVSGFLRGTRDVEGALDEVADALDDVSREAQDAGRDAGRALSDGIEDGARNAERAVDDLADSGKQLDRIGDDGKAAFDQVSDAAKSGMQTVEAEVDQAAAQVESATERMEQSFKDAFDSAGGASKQASQRTVADVQETESRTKASMQEIKQEGLQNASETFSSFDGSARSFADGIQGTFGGLVAGLGPVGAAIGAAGAIGIGLIGAAFDKSQEKAQELRDRIGEIRENFLAVRVDGESALSAVADRMRQIVAETDPDQLNLDRLTEGAEHLSEIDWTNYLRGVAGDPQARERAIELAERELQIAKDRDISVLDVLRGEGRERARQIADAERRLELLGAEQTAEEQAATARSEQAAAAIAQDEERARATEETNARIEEARGAHDERLAAARETNKQREEDMQQARVDAAVAADQQIAESVLGLTDAYAEVRDAAISDGEITAQELIGILDQQLADQEERIQAWAWAQQNLTTTQRGVLLDMGEDGFLALQGLINATPELRADALARLTAIGDRKGTAEANGVVGGLERTLPATVEGPAIRTRVDDSAWVAWANRVSRNGITVPIRVQTFGNQAV
ncbi:hypothetical protein [Jiangella sp. DSM 45060]|uniref:hypothetical protein n=1 Tax=Jiangella sp. DSM 45060 TaxID=1798224 RepID=UPI00087A1346|nr:hypothetical protein [Jiangella sp. DSM 45060]SDT69452.1 hypothetical protein SAMN04515669_6023 [Jiangella sp. DSM 45060]